MRNVFTGLAASTLILLLLTAGMGTLAEETAAQDRHVLAAVVTCLLSCLTQIVSFMYFAVTGKLIAQAVHLGELDPSPIEQSKLLRKAAARSLAVAVLSLVPVIATGAAQWRAREQNPWHLLVVFPMIAAHGLVLLKEWTLIRKNRALVDCTMTAYRDRSGKRMTTADGKNAVR